MFTRFKQLKSYIRLQQVLLAAMTSGLVLTVGAGDLDLADNALEVISAVEPNIMIVSDDSGSMDLGIMTLGPDAGGDGELKFTNRLYSYTHPDPGRSGDAPADNVFSKEVAITAEYLAGPPHNEPYPQHGAWRAWNYNYNRVYYNPNVTYKPWAGLDDAGNEYLNIDPEFAYYDPYRKGNGFMNLKNILADYSSHYSGSSTVTATGFYPARYYEWDDSNTLDPTHTPAATSINNGLVDADDDHQLYEIRVAGSQGSCLSGALCPVAFIRRAYDENTGIGRSDCLADNGNGTVTCTNVEEMGNFANWFTYYRKRGLTAKANFGFVIEDNTTARIGFATIHNNDNVRIRVASMNVSAKSFEKKALLDKIYDGRGSGGTPLRQNLRNVGRYYECASNDIFGSSGSSIPQSGNYKTCPVLPAPAGTCQQHYTVFLTDGFYNGNTPYSNNSAANKDTDGTGPYDGGAFADGVRNTLADVAMDYYERDLHSLTDDVSPTEKDIDRYPDPNGYTVNTDGDPVPMHQHMSTYTIGFGVQGSITAQPTNPTLPFTSWPTAISNGSDKIDDLMHAAYNGRGDFLQANNPVVLERGLTKIFNEIGATNGAASAVAFNTQNIESGSLVFRAFFDTKLNTGDLVAQRVNLDGTINPAIYWSAAALLDNRSSASADNRVIITYKDTGTSSSSGAPFRWTSLTTGVGSQQDILNTGPPTLSPPRVLGWDRLNWMRGHKQYEGPDLISGDFRERGPGGLLSDIIHSAPVFVGRPEFTNRDNPPFPNTPSELYSKYKQDNATRTGIVYVGANDGMLHAMHAASGNEVFAYVPNLVFPNLAALADPDYVHQFYVDLTPSANDVYYGGAWHTILVGGLGKGGKGYYSLDVTNPGTFSTEVTAANNVMWEFTESDDGGVGNSDLGFSYSKPLIAMTNAASGGQQRWAAIFGNGYNSTTAAGDAALYIVFVDAGLDGIWTAGSDYIKVSTGNGKAESADGTTPNGIGGVRGVDTDLNGTVDVVYAGDLQGNLYRFDLSSSTASTWTNNSSLDIIYNARYGSPSKDQPITNTPIVMKHPTEAGFIVIFGTGSWITTPDQTSPDIQSIYGVWDDLSNTQVTKQMLVEQDLINVLNPEHGFVVRTSSDNTVTWKRTGPASSQVRGWHIDLDMPQAGSASTAPEFAGERAVRNFQIRGGLLFVNTVIPRPTTQCTAGVGGYELGLNPLTGGSGSKIIFDIDDNGIFDINDNVANVDSDANIITGKRFDTSTPADSSFIGDVRVTQTSDKEVRSSKTNTSSTTGVGRHSWREIEL